MKNDQEKLNALGNACLGFMSPHKRLKNLKELYKFTNEEKLKFIMNDVKIEKKLIDENPIDIKVIDCLKELFGDIEGTEISRNFKNERK